MNSFSKYVISRIVLVCILLQTSPMRIHAQMLNPLNTYLQRVRIALVDEFFDRFNGKTYHPDIPVKDAESRKNNLLMLFDLSQFTSKNDTRFDEASDMMDIVTKNHIQINFSDTAWAAVAHCKGTLDGKSVKFDLLLRVQARKQDMVKWVIARADGNIFSITPRNDSDKIILSPDDHETNFMSLKRMTNEQPFNVLKFMANGFSYDATSVFSYLVYNKRLKIDYVDDLEFIFTQVPGYIFHVSYFDREKNNAGWLISKFYKSTQSDKKSFWGLLFPALPLENIKPQYSVPDTSNSLINKVKNYREMFIRRGVEKMAQLTDYIKSMQGRDTLRSLSVYKNKTIALFADNSKVYLYYPNSEKNVAVSVEEFCMMLIFDKMKFERLDSVCVPIWDAKINSLPLETCKIELASSMVPADKVTEGILRTDSTYKQKLYAYKEETEDGIEWLPVFGDMKIKVTESSTIIFFHFEIK